jgi:hypothetical protein
MSSSLKTKKNMPRRLYEFRCSKDHVTEQFVDETVKTSQCRECDEIATRIVSPTGIYLEPYSGLYPSSYDRWTRVRAEKLAQEKKRNADHGS